MSEGESWYQIFEKLGIPVERNQFKDLKGNIVFVASIQDSTTYGNLNLCSDQYPSEKKISEILESTRYP